MIFYIIGSVHSLEFILIILKFYLQNKELLVRIITNLSQELA